MDVFTGIINGDQAVIDQWLGEQFPDYLNNPVYQKIAHSLEENNPDEVAADKVFAYLTWAQVNNLPTPAIIETEDVSNTPDGDE